MMLRPTQPFNATMLARNVGLSRSHLFRSFKTELGCPPRYIADAARMEFSIGALREPQLQIGEIADSLGFSTPGHFVHFFSEHMGIAPGGYRRSLTHLILR